MKIDEIANSQEYIAIQMSPENGKKLTYLSTCFRQFRTKHEEFIREYKGHTYYYC